MAAEIPRTAPAVEWGYARVSTRAQTNDRQLDALTGEGIPAERIYTDKISGARQKRPGLDELLKVARPGDTITVTSLDRLGRSALHVMQTIADLTETGIHVRSLKAGENLEGATGKLMRNFMVLVAEWEREMNAERVAEARAARAARAEVGEQVAGRPRTAMTPAVIAAVKKRAAKGARAADIAKLEAISRASVYRILSQAPADR